MESGGASVTNSSDRSVSSISQHWSVFDGMTTFPSSPETLMAEIDSAVSAFEYSHASSLLNHFPTTTSQQPQQQPKRYDARLADQAYKVGCAALAAGKIDEAIRSLQLSLLICPPEKTSAISKLQSLLSLASQQIQKPS